MASRLLALPAVPFTPSQGVCTPSPTNMAAMWVPHPFFQQQQAWATMVSPPALCTVVLFAVVRSSCAAAGQYPLAPCLTLPSLHGAPSSQSGYGSPGHSSGGSDSSMMHSGSQPGTPGGGMYGAPVMWSGFCQPLPYSPTALQIAAASGALGSDPSTPVRGRPGSAGAGVATGPLFMPGSPVVLSPGQMMFAQVGGGRCGGLAVGCHVGAR